jgi:hypothetical protein
MVGAPASWLRLTFAKPLKIHFLLLVETMQRPQG